MRIAVAGSTGVVGRYVVAAAEQAGHDVVGLSRHSGVDVTDVAALTKALAGVEVVVDTLNARTVRREVAERFFTETSGRLQRAGADAGVGHLVTLSILNLDKASGYGYYAAKLAQERVACGGPVPATVLRAAQFHEFAAQIMAATKRGPVAAVPRIRSQPVAARTVGEHLVRAAEKQLGGIVELAGPEVEWMPDLARRLAAQRGVHVLVVPVPRGGGAAGNAMRTGVLLANETTTIDGPTFAEWLETDDANAVEF